MSDREAFNEALYYLRKLTPGELVHALSKLDDVEGVSVRGLKGDPVRGEREKVQFTIVSKSDDEPDTNGRSAPRRSSTRRQRAAVGMARALEAFPPEGV